MQVYISCSVLMCEAESSNTRCSQGCVTDQQPGTHPHRKREAGIQSANHFVSQGPLYLRSSTGNTRDTGETTGGVFRTAHLPGLSQLIKTALLFTAVSSLNLNVAFIAGCLLAAVGMICLVAMHIAKMSKVKYQSLPVFES